MPVYEPFDDRVSDLRPSDPRNPDVNRATTPYLLEATTPYLLEGDNCVDPDAKTGSRGNVWKRYGSVDQALAYGKIFMPDFFEIDGIVLIGGVSDALPEGREGLRELFHLARRRGGDALREYVEILNRVELPYLFAEPSMSVTQYRVLAELLVPVWQAQLNAAFPDNSCRVNCDQRPGEQVTLSVVQAI